LNFFSRQRDKKFRSVKSLRLHIWVYRKKKHRHSSELIDDEPCDNTPRGYEDFIVTCPSESRIERIIKKKKNSVHRIFKISGKLLPNLVQQKNFSKNIEVDDYKKKARKNKFFLGRQMNDIFT
jgi:hypothetical protein